MVIQQYAMEIATINYSKYTRTFIRKTIKFSTPMYYFLILIASDKVSYNVT